MLLHLVCSIFCKTVEGHIADAIVEHRGVGYVVDFDLFTFQFELDGLVETIAFDFEGHLCARLALQQLADLVGGLFVSVDPVDGKDGVTSLEACFLSWPALVGIGDTGVFAIVLDDGTDTAVFTSGHELIGLDFRFGDEHGIGIEPLQHGVDGGFVELCWVDLIHIVQVQFPEQAVVDVDAF